MSNTYLVGEQTKRRIFKESKKLFYSKGFTETTYDEISTAAKVNRALIPYHFKNKLILGQAIYNELTEEFTTGLNLILDTKQFSPDLTSVIHIMAHYRLLANPRYCRFVFQLLSEETSVSLLEHHNLIGDCLEYKASRFEPADIDAVCQMGAGIEKEIIRMIHTDKKGMDIDHLVRIKLHMLLGYIGYSKKKIDELADAAVTLLNLLSFQIKNSFTIEITYK